MVAIGPTERPPTLVHAVFCYWYKIKANFKGITVQVDSSHSFLGKCFGLIDANATTITEAVKTQHLKPPEVKWQIC